MTEVTQATIAFAKTFAEYVLPPQIISKIDVSHLVAEMERVDSDLTAAAVRATQGVQSQAIAPLAPQLMDFLVKNQLKIDDARMRSDIIKNLRLLRDKAPVIHMTFAVSADTESLMQLVQWMRTNLHPQAVITVGLQPGLVAGVYMRTPNHVHDLSLKAKLAANRGLLLKEVEALRGRS
jgi:hypothetical protein